MRKTLLLGAAAFMISLGISAQTAGTGDQVKATDQVRKQDRQRIHDPAQVQQGTMDQDQTRTLLQKKDRKRDRIHSPATNHGQVVSETAKTTESGKGKGQVVSQQARTQGEASQVRTAERKALRARPNGTGTGLQNTPGQGSARTTGRVRAGRR